MSAEMVFEFACKDCGQTFSASLQQIVQAQEKIMCPKCGQTREYFLADIRNLAA